MNSTRFKVTPIGPIPQEWGCVQIKDVVEPARKVTYGIVQPGAFDENGVILIRGQDYINGWSKLADFFRVSPNLHNQFRRSRVLPGDVLMCIVGYTGEANIVPDWITDANITQTTARIACDVDQFSALFMLHFLKSACRKGASNKVHEGVGDSQASTSLMSRNSSTSADTPRTAQDRPDSDDPGQSDREDGSLNRQVPGDETRHDARPLHPWPRRTRPTCATAQSVAPDLYKRSELGWIPKEWDEGTIDDFCDIHNHLRFPISSEQREQMQGEYAYYGPTGVFDWLDHFRVDGEYALIGEDGDHFLKFASQPMTILARGKFNVNNHAHLLKGKQGYSTEWVFTFYCHRDIKAHLTHQGAGRLKLNKASLRAMPLVVPQPSEQAIICERFRSVNSRTSTEQTQLDKLRRLKTGLMQDLLTGKVRAQVEEQAEDG